MRDFSFKKFEQQLSRQQAKSNRLDMLMSANGKCEICGFFCPYIIDVHHKIPVKDGGNGHQDNLACLCPNCHAIVERWRKFKANRFSKNQYKNKMEYAMFCDWVHDTFSEEVSSKLKELAGIGYDD